MSERERDKQTERPQTQGRSTPTPGCSIRGCSQGVSDPGSSSIVLSLPDSHPLGGLGVTGPQSQPTKAHAHA